MAKATLHIVYDGDCPFCSGYVALLRLREQYDVRLVDADGLTWSESVCAFIVGLRR